MARLLIVSRSMALAMRLADQHEVIEHPADDLAGLLPEIDGDVLVLDIGDAVLAVNTVNSLREAEQDIPVLLVSGYQPEWEQVEAQRVEGVHVVPLPITRAALLLGIAELVGEEPPPPTPPHGASLPEHTWGSGTGPATGQVAAARPGPYTGSVPRPPTGSTPVQRNTDNGLDDAPSSSAPVTDPVVGSGESSVDSPEDESNVDDAPAVGTEAARMPDADTPAAGVRAADVRAADAPADEVDEAEIAADDEVEAGIVVAPAAEVDEESDDLDAAGSEADFQPTDDTDAFDDITTDGTAAEADPDAFDDTRYEPAPPEPLARPFGPGSNGHPRSGSLPIGRPGSFPVDPVPVAPGSGGLSYSASITRPFDDEPLSGPMPVIDPVTRTPFSPRWLRGGAPGPTKAAEEARPAENKRLSRLGNRPRKLQRPPAGAPDPLMSPAMNPGAGGGLATDPMGPPTPEAGVGVGVGPSDLDRRLDAAAADLVRRPSDTGAMVLRTADLVRMLHDRAGDLYGVSDTAQVLADDVIERADADAAAVLVPDGPVWRVSGGVGLRPLERRLVLEDSHWLIAEIGSVGRAVLIEDTDIIRQELAGAPLAAWRHLLAVPVPDVRAIVILARGQEGGPFTDRDLNVVISPVREAAALLSMAVETRRLARMLSPLREQDGIDANGMTRRPH